MLRLRTAHSRHLWRPAHSRRLWRAAWSGDEQRFRSKFDAVSAEERRNLILEQDPTSGWSAPHFAAVYDRLDMSQIDSRLSIFLSFVHLVAELYGAGEVAANSVRPQSPSRVTVTPRVARAANAACIFADKPCRPPRQIQITAVNKRRGVKTRRSLHLGPY